MHITYFLESLKSQEVIFTFFLAFGYSRVASGELSLITLLSLDPACKNTTQQGKMSPRVTVAGVVWRVQWFK